jgi:[ribosomal protein S5]-alanine N-acetyltransferase
MFDIKVEDIFSETPKLETDMVRFRRITFDDASDMFEYASEEDVAKFVTWPAHKTLDDSKQFITSIIERYSMNQVAPWGVALKDSNKLIGTCDFVHWYPNHGRAVIGYVLGKKYWGRGIITNAVKEMINFGFESMKLNRIEARCKIENIGSEKVMIKNGMKFEGILRQSMYAKSKYHDLKIYSILRSEYY